MSVEKYSKYLLYLLVIFILFHYMIWNLYTKQLFDHGENMHVGDLGRMSYITSSLTPREDRQDLSHKHINFSKIEDIDILTIGDSVSNGGAGGTNKFYQDYIATNQNFKVMNIQPSKKGYIETVVLLKNSGILNKLNPKVIILQSVERSSIQRLSQNINWDMNDSIEYIIDFLVKKRGEKKPLPLFINTLNYKAILYSIFYKYDDNALFSKVYISVSSNDLFSCEDANQLLFYYEDLDNLKLSTYETIGLLNNNLNKLQDILTELNIKLYFMPVVDKYNLYSKYIQDNKYPKSSFFELLRREKKQYNLIDTKKILEKLIDNNIKDVYYSDDTHWSYKASKEIFEIINLE